MYLAIDLGTTGCRSMLVDQNSEIVAVEYEEYGLITPKEGYVEQKAENWWEMTLRTAAKAIQQAGINGEEIEGISISSQGITVVPVDEKLVPLCNALSWLDTRAELETTQIRAEFGDQKIFTLTGKPITSSYTLPKILWLQKNRPDVFQKAYKFLMPMDFLVAKFTGSCVTDYSMASGTLMYDIKQFCWSREILDFYAIAEDKLPQIVAAGSKAGIVLPEVAEKLGLKKDCVVAVGAQDQKCAAYGAGLQDGVMTISLGTAAAITKLWKTAKTEENHGVGWCGYIDRGEFVTEGVIGTAGTCLRWTRDMLFRDEAYDVIDKEAEEARRRGSSLLFFPYLAGASSPDYYPDSEGVFYGLNLATKRGDFALAVMEGIAFQIRVILEAMQAYGNIHTLVLFGGGAKSEFWAATIANVTGMKISVPKSAEAAGVGATRLAAKAVGKPFQPMENGKVYLPEHAKEYQEKYFKYRSVEKKLWGNGDQ